MININVKAGVALTKREGQERPLFESLEDCQAAIGLLTRRDAVEVLQAMDPSQRRRLVEAFGRLSGGENKSAICLRHPRLCRRIVT